MQGVIQGWREGEENGCMHTFNNLVHLSSKGE